MEADILRLILFLIGAAVIFGIYAADRYKRRKYDKPTQDRTSKPYTHPAKDHIEPSWDSTYESTELEAESDEPQLDQTEGVDSEDEDFHPNVVDEAIANELGQLEDILHQEHEVEPDEVAPKEQISISFLTGEVRKNEGQDYDISLPSKILQLNIVPHEGEFYGDDILCVVQEVGLELGDMDIFHHYEGDSDMPQAVYSMASMVEPGTFPIDIMDDYSTPGLTLFSRLPGPKDGLTIFADMLYAAEQLANLLDGELRDETHSALSKQTISHIREEIQEHHRQLQLARSKK